MSWVAILFGGPADGLKLRLPPCDRYAEQICIPNQGSLEEYSYVEPLIDVPSTYRYAHKTLRALM